jgi:hypothetical protein
VAQAIKSVDRGKKEADHAHVDSDEGRVGEEIGSKLAMISAKSAAPVPKNSRVAKKRWTTNVNWRI